MIQGSQDWFAQRAGKVTASRIADVVAKTKSGWSASRDNYAAQLIAERLTGVVADTFTNAAMQWGTETEPQAKAAYTLFTGRVIQDVGFVPHPSIPMSGASPDGLVEDNGLVEIKCPNTATHLETLLGSAIDGKYIKQMQWQMACTNKAWCDFVSFDPRLPVNMQCKIIRVDRDAELIALLEKEVGEFLAEIEAKIKQLNERY